MTTHSLQFDAVSEAQPGPKWQARWQRSWPAYRSWFLARQGDQGPNRADCETALNTHMPELLPLWRQLAALAGDDDLAARFLSTWCPPAYLGGCSLAAVSRNGDTRLVRNYDLSPELNEGLLLHSSWTGRPVMGMVEFLWGVSDGINADGLAVALAFGGRESTGRGFGITTILRYVLETCTHVAEALAVLQRVPSHMAYNISLADRSGMTLAVELQPGGGVRIMEEPIATNHQHGPEPASRPEFTQTVERLNHLSALVGTDIPAPALAAEFLQAPLFQRNYGGGLGTLFTAEYDPAASALRLLWQDDLWEQSLDRFVEGSRTVRFDEQDPAVSTDWTNAGQGYPQSTRVANWNADWNANATDMNAEPSVAPEGRRESVSWLDELSAISPYVANPEAFHRWLDAAHQGHCNWSSFGQAFYREHGMNH